jgi:hypothetical protein
LAELVREKQTNEKAAHGDALIWNEHEHVGFPVSRFSGLLGLLSPLCCLMDNLLSKVTIWLCQDEG